MNQHETTMIDQPQKTVIRGGIEVDMKFLIDATMQLIKERGTITNGDLSEWLISHQGIRRYRRILFVSVRVAEQILRVLSRAKKIIHDSQTQTWRIRLESEKEGASKWIVKPRKPKGKDYEWESKSLS